MATSSATPSTSQYEHANFFAQPGDIILLDKPLMLTDGTYGPMVKLYKDKYYLVAQSSYRSSMAQVHIFEKNHRVLRLFKLYQNWEFAMNQNHHEMYLYYPGFVPGSWYLVNKAASNRYANDPPCKSHVTHISPSLLYSLLPKDVFSPRVGDIIIRTVMTDENVKPVVKSSCQNCVTMKNLQLPSVEALEMKSVDPDFHAYMSKGRCKKCTDAEEENMAKPWKVRWEIKHWSPDLDVQNQDYLVRVEMDADYKSAFKHTHIQVELFCFDKRENKWGYLGMDVGQFGPMIEERDKLYYPEPGDILISREPYWILPWDAKRQVGGYVLLHKDASFFGKEETGQAMWYFDSARKEAKFKYLPQDAWLVRLGTFDKFWDYTLNDKAQVFLKNTKGDNMSLHHTSDYQHVAQPANFDFEQEPVKLLEDANITPNHWDLIVRQTFRREADPTGFQSGDVGLPDYWMRDPMLWGRDDKPRIDKQVEIFTFWSGFEFRENDLLVRAGYSLDKGVVRNPHCKAPDEPLPPPRKPGLPPPRTAGTVELYLVDRFEEHNTPRFSFLGRDKTVYPSEDFTLQPDFKFLEHKVFMKPGTEIPPRLYPKKKPKSNSKKGKEAPTEGVHVNPDSAGNVDETRKG